MPRCCMGWMSDLILDQQTERDYAFECHGTFIGVTNFRAGRVDDFTFLSAIS